MTHRKQYTGSPQHAEAFALMVYTDQTTGEEELLWNSRDGITPFCITSRAGNEARHTHWRRDEPAPLHVPAVGDRVFVDLTLARAREHRRAWVEKHWARWPQLAEDFETQEAAVAQLAELDMREPGSPDLVVVDEELRAYFARRVLDFRGLMLQEVAPAPSPPAGLARALSGGPDAFDVEALRAALTLEGVAELVLGGQRVVLSVGHDPGRGSDRMGLSVLSLPADLSDAAVESLYAEPPPVLLPEQPAQPRQGFTPNDGLNRAQRRAQARRKPRG